MATALESIIGGSKAIRDILSLIKTAASTRSSILIQGETGTGKELVARALHEASPRVQEPFIVVNCSALAETLLESELFGHERGAFTGAFRMRRGRFETADKGTLFIDEIGGMSLQTQVKLLRVLQEGEFQRVGGEEEVAVDVRLVVATNRNLKQEVKQGRFREDLFYRVNVIPIFVPPLRARRGDIPTLARYFARMCAGRTQRPVPDIEPAAMDALSRYDWPGNVRELENMIERVFLLASGPSISLSDLPTAMISRDSAGGDRDLQGLSSLREALSNMMHESQDLETVKQELKDMFREVEEEGIRRALIQYDWKQRRAARELKMDESTLRYLMKRYGIIRPGNESPASL